MRSVLFALFLIAATVDAVAETPVTAGAGMTSCSEFAEFYRRSPDITETGYFGWAQGYMSATNNLMRVLNKPTRNLMGIPTSAQKRHLRTFCDQRPLSNFYDAVRSLYESLPENLPKSN